MSFVATSVTAAYDDAAPVLTSVSLTVQPGSICALIGPNGSGKSTLLRVLLGSLAPLNGDVTLDGKAVQQWDRSAFARRVGVVTQIEEMPFAITVRELVSMGRYPHLGALRGERTVDREAIDAAMERCDVAQFSSRPLQTLSGGERQRARIARALAQTPDVLVLDEPTTALDIAHEMRVFELLRSLARDEHRTVIVATHQLNLAGRYADALLLLSQGRMIVHGPPAAVLRADVLEQVYAWPVAVQLHPGPGFDTGAPQVAPLSRNRMEDS
jgi:ABC-type cobalamin/Fe3+-siderophores transport system ATPase subunit